MDARYLVDSGIIIYFLEGILTPKSYEIVTKAIAPKPILSIVIIAATAIAHSLTLLTRNEKDFKSIPGLRWINPF